MIIIANDPNVYTRKRSVVVRKMYPSHRVAREMGVFHVWRTNGVVTEHVVIGLIAEDGGYRQGVYSRKREFASESDKYYYDQEQKEDNRRNDKLVKACNEAYNRLLKCGYLSKVFGVRGWVKEIDGSNVRIFLNTDASSRVISSLLKAWNPQYEWTVVGG